jgi:hypothetical protein
MPHHTPTEILTLHAVRILGYADSPQIAARFDLHTDTVNVQLLDAQARGLVSYSSYAGVTGWSLTDAGKARNEQMLAAELVNTGARLVVEQVYEDFLPYNATVSGACTAWQLADMGIGDTKVTIGETVAQLTSPLQALNGLEARLTARLHRFAGYHERFASALNQARTDPAWVTATDRASCHRVWFEFHEDLIASLGLAR